MKQSFLTDTASLLSEKLDVARLGAQFAQAREEKVVSIATSLPDVMANFPEEEKLIILIDIVGFSQSTTREQVYKIYLFQKYLSAHLLNNSLRFGKKIKLSQSVPTGDGCYLIAEPCESTTALDFLLSLISGFKELQDKSEKPMALRASALIGSCVPFLDMAHHKNYIGDGMNEAARILSGGQKSLEAQFLSAHPEKTEADAKQYSQNALYVGDSLAGDVARYADACNAIVRYDAVADKHGKTRGITVLQGVK